MALAVTGACGWNYAEPTAGGVTLDEIDPATMASRKCDGLYLVGEILDVDDRIGGFNLSVGLVVGLRGGPCARRRRAGYPTVIADDRKHEFGDQARQPHGRRLRQADSPSGHQSVAPGDKDAERKEVHEHVLPSDRRRRSQTNDVEKYTPAMNQCTLSRS